MNNASKLISIRFALAVAASLAASAVSSHAQSATATISGVLVGSTYDYTITLKNTGADNLNDFWYGWIQFENDLPSNPTVPSNSLGWDNTLSGNSIQWVNSTGTALAPGQSGIFTFDSSSTPAQMTAGIAGESVAYVGGIDFSQNSPGDSTPIFAPTLVAAPEPSALGLLMVGLFVMAISLRFWTNHYQSKNGASCRI
jgi:uncharacterized repeat protein (TIGR01451 family)